MAKTKQKVQKGKRVLKAGPEQHILKEALRDFGVRNITIYATEVNLARSVPDLMDGLKPVQRRILWSASQQTFDKEGIKSARYVGDTIARYHAHGDLAVYGAMVTMVTSAPVPLLFGRGNWGSLIDGAAAMRYTNCGLTEYGKLFFQPDYINKEVTSFVPNYDGKDIEPVSLPAPLPHVLLSGAEGIGLGITTCLPSFTPESLISVLRSLLKGEKLQREDFAKVLKVKFRWGGQPVKSKANREAWLQLFNDSEATVQYEAPLDIDRATKSMVIRDWPPGLDPEKFVEKVRALKETKAIYNTDDAVTFRIECRTDYNFDQFDQYAQKIQRLTRKSKAYKVNVTRRTARVVDGVTQFKTEMLAMPIPELLMLWLKERIDLELRSLEYRMARQARAIHHSKLLIYASDKLDVIFKGLKRSDTEDYLVTHLKRPLEDVKTILALQVRQLSRLDAQEITKKLKAQQKHMDQLEQWKAKPKKKVLLDLDTVEQALDADVKSASKRAQEELKIAA